MKQIFRMSASQLLVYITSTAEAVEEINKRIQKEELESVLRALETTLSNRKKRNKLAHMRLQAMQRNENPHAIEVIFGYFTFLEEQRDGEFKALIHSVDTIEYYSAETIDSACEKGLYRHESYLIPSQYGGVIEID